MNRLSNTPLIGVTLLCLLLLFSCKSDPRGEPVLITEETEEPDISEEIGAVNFYLENSGSMNPYAKGSTDFNLAMVQLLSNIELLSKDTVKIFAANTEVHPIDKDLKNFLASFSKSGIPTLGNTGNSDLHLIFENVLDNHKSDDISILVTDAIYSVKGSREELLKDLEEKVYRTRNKFIQTLQKKDIAILGLKMSSNYNGKYYPAIGGEITINQERPYYVWILGESHLLKSFAEQANVFELPNLKNFLHELDYNLYDPDFSILEHTIGQIGKFRKDSRSYPVHVISNAEKSDRRNSEGKFGFAVAVDFSQVPMLQNYFLNESNYEVVPDDYVVKEIKAVGRDLGPQELKYLEEIQKKSKHKYTHIIFLETTGKFVGTYRMDLKKQKPMWIIETGMEDDENIKGNTTQTFGFEKLTTGILEAYQEVNNQDKLLSLELTIK